MTKVYKFGNTQSEMIVPVFSHAGQKAIGLIDLVSERLNAFGDADHTYVEGCGALVVGLWK
jgi:putative methionine-R-sulfoxide reductase with GAF domain